MFRCMRVVVIGFAAPLSLTQAPPADGVVGNGTPASCTEAALTTALVGGGTITFNCGGPKTGYKDALTKEEIYEHLRLCRWDEFGDVFLQDVGGSVKEFEFWRTVDVQDGAIGVQL